MSQNLFAHKDFLNLKGNDVYVDLGGGRGNTVIVSKLMKPSITAISIEIDKQRHQQAISYQPEHFCKCKCISQL
jgi:tRNA G46 methylase TrmB